MLASLLLTAAAAASVSATGARFYAIQDTYMGPSFLSGWSHQNIPDPTHGRVNYVSQSVALAKNLTFVSSDTLILRSDSTTVLTPSGPGRDSVRLISNKQYGTSVTVIDLRHMPQGCATWPAFWTTSSTAPWPSAGEIDIIEGVNDVGPNAATLHTLDGCTMVDSKMTDTGTLTGTNCFWGANYNQGCQVQVNKPNSYGSGLNSVGGGWYAMERTSTFINVWFWARNDPSVPSEVANGSGSVNPAHWGKPFANFVNSNCDINSRFGNNNLIINLTFCGDWAAAPGVYPGPNNCPGTCVDFVNNNPNYFAQAFWDIKSVRVYGPGCAAPTKRDLDAHRHHAESREL